MLSDSHHEQTMEIIETSKNNTQDFLKVNRKSGIITGTVRVFEILDTDTNQLILFCPSLSLSSYGDNLEEAKEMFKENFDFYCKNLIEMSAEEMDSELIKFGWTKRKFHKQFVNSAHVDTNGVLQNFDLPKETQIKEEVLEF